LNEVARAMRYAAGYQPLRDGETRRIAPSGGGLGSAELFVIARGVNDLEDGIYHYYAPRHVLERLREAPDDLIAGALGICSSQFPQAVLVGTASLMKLRQKYGYFSFRFANLDAGVACGYLQECLTAMGLPYVEYPGLRDKAMVHVLGLPTAGNRAIITYAIGVGGPRVTSSKPLIVSQIIESLVDQASTITPGAPCSGPEQMPSRSYNHPPTHHETLGKLLLRRRSVREYSQKVIPGYILRSIIELAADSDRSRVEAGGVQLRMNLWLALREGNHDIAPGIYRWENDSRELRRIRGNIDPAKFRTIMLQGSLSGAPALLLITGDFEDAVTTYGARGYRELMSRAGSICARSLIALYGHDMTACPWGGIIEDEWGELLGIDRYSDCPLFAVSMGYQK
jgi:SagB-type dehydrogenase family enzyme